MNFYEIALNFREEFLILFIEKSIFTTFVILTDSRMIVQLIQI